LVLPLINFHSKIQLFSFNHQHRSFADHSKLLTLITTLIGHSTDLSIKQIYSWFTVATGTYTKSFFFPNYFS